MSLMPFVNATPGMSGISEPTIMFPRLTPKPMRWKTMHRRVASALPTMFPIGLLMCGPPAKTTKVHSSMPTTKAAAASSSPPPKIMQKPAEPTAEPRICSHAALGLLARISSSRPRASSTVYLPASMSREIWLTAATLSSCAPLKGMNSTLA